VSVEYSTGDYSTTAGTDYTSQSGTLTFGASESSKTVSVPITGDTIDENDEQFYVSLSNAVGGQFVDSYGVGTIQDDDTDPVFSISSAPTVVEGSSGTVSAVFTVTLVGEHDGGVTVDYSTFDYTAAAGADYTAKSGTLTFGVGETSKEISVPILDDTIDEYEEQFYVRLSNAVQAKIGDSYYGYGTIQDNDDAPLITISDVSKNEGQRNNTSFTFTVSLSSASGKWIYVDFATANGTATTADSDYFANSGTAYIAPGSMSTTITVTVRGDKKKELNETFLVNLTGATDGTIADNQGAGTIVNDDGRGNGKNGSQLTSALLVDAQVTTNRKRR
jgi:hypothetical protein